jgi:hypothetical protein
LCPNRHLGASQNHQNEQDSVSGQWALPAHEESFCNDELKDAGDTIEVRKLFDAS